MITYGVTITGFDNRYEDIPAFSIEVDAHTDNDSDAAHIAAMTAAEEWHRLNGRYKYLGVAYHVFPIRGHHV